MRSVVVSMCVFLGTLRIAQPENSDFRQRLAGRLVPGTRAWRDAHSDAVGPFIYLEVSNIAQIRFRHPS